MGTFSEQERIVQFTADCEECNIDKDGVIQLFEIQASVVIRGIMGGV
jgi:hypothetical protein